MGAHCHVVEPDGSLRLNCGGQTDHAHVAVSRIAGDAARRHMECDRHARHHVEAPIGWTMCSCPRRSARTREDPTLRRDPGRLYAFPMQGIYAVGVAGVAMGIARAMLDAFVELATRKTPRNLGRLADNAVVQANVAQMEARLGAARAYLVEALSDIWDSRDDDRRSIDVPARARVRLACAFAIQTAEAVADYAYKAAGRTRSSSAPRSSAGSATSTRCRNRSSRGLRISNRSGRSCWASNRPGRSCRVCADRATRPSGAHAGQFKQHVRLQLLLVEPVLHQIADADDASEFAVVDHWQMANLARVIATRAASMRSDDRQLMIGGGHQLLSEVLRQHRLARWH